MTGWTYHLSGICGVTIRTSIPDFAAILKIEIIVLSNGIDFDGTFKHKQIPSDALKAAPKFYSKYQKHIELLNDKDVDIKPLSKTNALSLLATPR